MSYVNPGPNQQICERCGRACLVRRVVTTAPSAAAMDGGNTLAVCCKCWEAMQ